MIHAATTSHSDALDRFITVYTSLRKDNLSTLEEIYSEDVVFEDPAHRIEGYDNLSRYFETMYANVTDCRFDIHDHAVNGEVAFISWTMTLSHPKLEGGAERAVNGCTRLVLKEGRVILHRDYFDLGEMLYEALPVLGIAVRIIKKRLGQ
ncbi:MULTISPECIES: nuclear transport factor 2 family protein [Grimontia]|uniref:SnoaL-like domain protein n=1 Tax=Grimontia marina TaxID=646534 RepID=A0A128FCZ8_9GAMM|nr:MULTISPECIES: nuclear transport factor 2 family protein [Grimontia]WRW00015.1 nuclear transport factor 2 family protein [Grimontia sp. NTOU-MAR1]CZF84214.1 SnoaL-like domain protein [Grimontia marina]